MNDPDVRPVPSWMRQRAQVAAAIPVPFRGRPSNAEQRLMSYGWCMRNSIFVLGGLGGGLTGWASFLYLGLRARRRRWLFYAAFWGLFALGAGAWLVVTLARGTDRLADETVFIWMLWGALIQVLHLVFIRDPWLRWRAVHPTGTADWATYPELMVPFALYPLKAPIPRKPSGNGVLDEIDGGERHGILDINFASAADLVRDLGIGDGWAHAIVETRDRLGGFRSVDDLALAGLPPALYNAIVDRLQPVIAASSRPSGFAEEASHPEGSPPGPQPPRPGRRLDL